MQNRYAGDVGDFGKLGLLRILARSGLRIGLNWYLVPDESHNADGKHTGYLRNEAFRGCDDDLLSALGGLVISGQRNVGSLEAARLVTNARYYDATLHPPNTAGAPTRAEWHRSGLLKLNGTNVVFLDPDNGLLVKSVGLGSYASVKYVLLEELQDYYRVGHSVIFYNHRCRLPEDAYLERFRALRDSQAFPRSKWLGLSFRRGTVRDYFFILQPDHAEVVAASVDEYLRSNWRHHSRPLDV